MKPCPCGSESAFAECCEPILKALRPAPTALALMRSRYTAYTLGDIEYLTRSLHPDSRHDHDPDAARRWASNSKWLGLEILNQEAGQPDDREGRVDFIAKYRDQRGLHRHHEIARFVKLDDCWYFLDALAPEVTRVQHDAPKTGRNDSCPCGSGKKFKKCCGK